jgi:L-lactate dehydrogenase complex protein LldG
VARLFAERVAEYRAKVHHTAPDGLAALLATVLVDAGDRRVVAPPGLPARWLAGLPESIEVVLDDGDLSTAELDDVDAVVTGCTVAIAETGTVVLDAAPDQGRRVVTLLPDHHVCVVAAERIVATVPEGLARLYPTRPLTMVSGPSATSDIELDRVEGVHGPRNLDVVIVSAT